MSTFKDRGIVLRETPHGEYDKNLTVLLYEHGKSYLYIKGARRPKSKLAGTEIFSYCEFVIFEGKGFNSVTQLEILDSYYMLRNDYDVYCRAAYMLELTEKLMQQQMNAAVVLDLLKFALAAMCKNPVNSMLVHVAYIMKLLELEGFRPELLVCADCGESLDLDYFSESGLCCRSCLGKHSNSIHIDRKTVDAMNYIYNTDSNLLFTKNADEKLLESLQKSISFFESQNVDLIIKSKKLFG